MERKKVILLAVFFLVAIGVGIVGFVFRDNFDSKQENNDAWLALVGKNENVEDKSAVEAAEMIKRLVEADSTKEKIDFLSDFSHIDLDFNPYLKIYINNKAEVIRVLEDKKIDHLLLPLVKTSWFYYLLALSVALVVVDLMIVVVELNKQTRKR